MAIILYLHISIFNLSLQKILPQQHHFFV